MQTYEDSRRIADNDYARGVREWEARHNEFWEGAPSKLACPRGVAMWPSPMQLAFEGAGAKAAAANTAAKARPASTG